MSASGGALELALSLGRTPELAVLHRAPLAETLDGPRPSAPAEPALHACSLRKSSKI